jgi:hypothetical protein
MALFAKALQVRPIQSLATAGHRQDVIDLGRCCDIALALALRAQRISRELERSQLAPGRIVSALCRLPPCLRSRCDPVSVGELRHHELLSRLRHHSMLGGSDAALVVRWQGRQAGAGVAISLILRTRWREPHHS